MYLHYDSNLGEVCMYLFGLFIVFKFVMMIEVINHLSNHSVYTNNEHIILGHFLPNWFMGSGFSLLQEKCKRISHFSLPAATPRCSIRFSTSIIAFMDKVFWAWQEKHVDSRLQPFKKGDIPWTSEVCNYTDTSSHLPSKSGSDLVESWTDLIFSFLCLE